MNLPVDLIIQTPFKDYIAPPAIIDAAGYDLEKPGYRQKKAEGRLFAWADWMQYCEFGVNPNWSKRSP